jgi:hypothetical protein
METLYIENAHENKWLIISFSLALLVAVYIAKRKTSPFMASQHLYTTSRVIQPHLTFCSLFPTPFLRLFLLASIYTSQFSCFPFILHCSLSLFL